MPAQDDVSLQSSHRIFSASPPTPRQLAPSHDQKLTCMGVLIESCLSEQWTCLGYRDKALSVDVPFPCHIRQHFRQYMSTCQDREQSSRAALNLIIQTRLSSINAHIVTLCPRFLKLACTLSPMSTPRSISRRARECVLMHVCCLLSAFCVSAGISWQISLATPRISLSHFVIVKTLSLQNLTLKSLQGPMPR